ncbi:beta-glucosidase BglX [Paenibacillus polymyxa]|uniref:beta-glucosidase BglX n=1 Tax=Paenibacillus polymyxa TaxID=1406 RepID=UPI002024E516|nr:beta-glucosidase BglX [Paenibacillus polymyxa]MDU8674831.1 beta-glucosidase BglX [Paenibacillus polymyxa]MDU8699738.1 beta-glucosidase BglX [Paenibacillus polymyxa]URJ54381.1 beta-glucosidase BglX [Paenibacillus polymyxa]URJ66224.1 beta-glucosidase BglX [Paenibacillus polymyxa]URJ68890.1 beta-glucosidase BglX [Paenibacillus polymyxa]
MDNKTLLEKLNSLSIEEKIGQLIQLTGDFFEGDMDTVVTGPLKKLGLNTDYNIYNTGSILNITNPEKIIRLQTDYLEKSVHKIPLLFMADIIYGYRTIFPIPIAQACSWNYEGIENAASIAAQECYEEGIHVTFSPMVDMVRDPRWGRVMESPGEDTLLAQKYAQSVVLGIQGSNLEDGAVPANKIAACVKHFAAYGAPVAGREYNAVDLSEHALREYYLPGYQAAIEAGAKLVMTAFNTLNGIPATGNEWLNRDVLRQEMKFDGVLISDYAAIEELIMHGYAEDETSAARLALLAGVDVDMKTAVYANQLKNVISGNDYMLELLNEAVYRVLQLKNDLGLFEDPFRGLQEIVKRSTSSILSDEHKQAALSLVEESVVLLKNENNVLPLSKETKVALMGPYAEENSTLGMWAIKGEQTDTINLKTGLLQLVGSDNLSVCRGSYLLPPDARETFDKYADKLAVETGSEEVLLQEAIRHANEAEVIVLALGESIYQSGEGGSRTNPTLPEPQLRLLHELSLLGKRIVLIVYSGRPLILTDVAGKVDAIVQAWYPGTMGGEALANILYGEVNPSGKLAMTFPRSVGQIPVYYNELNTGRPNLKENGSYRFASRYIDEVNEPLYPFGYGLSYTSFEYTLLTVSQKEMKTNESVDIRISVSNTGTYAGKETIQLYIRDKFASIARPVKELKDFKKVFLQSGETTIVEFSVDEDMLKFYGREMEYKSEPGEFEVYIGSSSQQILLSFSFTLLPEDKHE